MSLLSQLGMGIWPWEWPGDIADALKDAIGLIGAVIIAFFIFIFGLGVIFGKIPVPGGNWGKWIVFLIAFGFAAGIIYYIVIIGG